MTSPLRADGALRRLAPVLVGLAAVLCAVPGSAASPAGHASGTGASEAASDSGKQVVLVARSASRAGGIDSSHRPDQPDSAHRFGIAVGSSPLLYPGLRVRIPITFRNTQDVPISVRTAALAAIGPAGCGAEDYLKLGTRRFVHRVLVPVEGSKQKFIGLKLLKSAPDACQGAVFDLSVQATAVRG